ncbi:MAG TPA: peptidoglycan endopeptidase [Allosphingosinicella sp.]|nr:peptidoglycan endopeptidase [Allosphingosinicella sp.]
MTARAERVVARARALIGVRFRPQGRSRTTGLDCIGVAAAAIESPSPPGDYALRGGSAARLAEELAAVGLRRVEEAAPGDVVVLAPGQGQLHLAVLTATGLVHGDAGLRRVVERPGPPPWPIASIWRIGED